MNRLRGHFLAAFITISPIIYPLYNMETRNWQEKFFQCAAIILVSMFIGNFWIMAFIIWNVFLFLYHCCVVGAGQVFNIFLASLIFMVSRWYFKKNDIKEFFPYIIFVGLVSMSFMVLQLFGQDPINVLQRADGIRIQEITVRQPVGLFNIQMASGIYLTLVYCIMTFTSFYLPLVLIVPIMLSQSSAVFMSFASVLTFLSYFYNRKLFIALLIATQIEIGAYLVYDFQKDQSTFRSRGPFFKQIVKQSFSYPLGYGPGSFAAFHKHKNFNFAADYDYVPGFIIKNGQNLSFQYAEVKDKDKAMPIEESDGNKFLTIATWREAHNEILQQFFEYGFVGLFLMFGFMREIIMRFRAVTLGKPIEAIDKELITVFSCFIVYFVSSLTQFPLHLARLGYLFPILLGYFYARTDYAFSDT